MVVFGWWKWSHGTPEVSSVRQCVAVLKCYRWSIISVVVSRSRRRRHILSQAFAKAELLCFLPRLLFDCNFDFHLVVRVLEDRGCTDALRESVLQLILWQALDLTQTGTFYLTICLIVCVRNRCAASERMNFDITFMRHPARESPHKSFLNSFPSGWVLLL